MSYLFLYTFFVVFFHLMCFFILFIVFFFFFQAEDGIRDGTVTGVQTCALPISTAYEGDNYLLPSVAAVVLGGTSLLGGRGNLVATAIAALFLTQLDQFVLALGVSYASRTLVQAAALAVGVALYTIDWRRLTRRVLGRRSVSLAPA